MSQGLPVNGAKKRRASSPRARIIHNFEDVIALGLVEKIVADELSKFAPPHKYYPMYSSVAKL
jgi:hypothetical protein